MRNNIEHSSVIERLRWTQRFFNQSEMSKRQAKMTLLVLGEVLLIYVRKMAIWRCVCISPEDKC